MAPKIFWQSLFGFLLMLTIPAFSMAGKPTEQLKETTDKIIAVLADPALKAPEKKKEKQALLRKIADERFDWTEMSRRTLARHWRKRTENEQKEFVELYSKHLERTYRDKIDDYSGETVRYEDEIIDGNYARVTAKVITKKETEIPVIYRMKQKGQDWLVYDISVEGVSLINNFRKQFNSIILRSSYQKLVDMLRTKVEEEGAEKK